MRWEKGFSSSCYLSIIDPATWRDVGRIDITGGKVSRSEDELIEAADIDCVEYDQSAERYVRVWMDTRQSGATDHVALFTGLATSPDRDINGNLTTNSVACYSVLKPAQDVLLERGWFVPAGTNGAEKAAQLLSVTPAPKVIEGVSPALQENIIAEDDESNLSMALKIIDAINWRIRLDGDGTIRIMPKASTISATFDYLDSDMIETQVKLSYDWFACPNVFRAISDDLTAIARDDDPDSPLSTVNRGREIWAQESDCDLNDAESIEEYASRMLHQLQIVAREATYDRRFHPDVTVGDFVMINYPGQGIDGVFMVRSQTLELDKNGRTSEEVCGVE